MTKAWGGQRLFLSQGPNQRIDPTMDAMAGIGSSEPLRVLHVVHSLHPGGMENGIVNMARQLAPRGIIADICCLTTKGDFASRLPKTSTVFELHKPDRISVLTAWRLHQLLSHLRPHVLHAHNWSGLLYAVLSGSRGGALLQGEHAQLTAWERARRRLISRHWLYAACAGVHTVSEGQKKELVALGIAQPRQVVAIINGVDSHHFQPGDQTAARDIIGLPREGLVVGMVARCIPDKRHDRALEAFAKLASERREVHLLLAGEGGNIRDRVFEAARCHPHADRIHWLGQRDDMRPVYQAMDLLVVPSEVEGLSNACLESMASGVPVLANDSCGATEVVKDGVTGFIRHMRNADDLAAGLREALSDLNRLLVMGAAARDHAVREFSIAAMTDRYEEVYRSLAAGRKQSPRASNPSQPPPWIS